MPDLEPRVIVLSGDLTQRARHGELQAAAAFVRELERTASVFVIPGNHDVRWWYRPLLPIATKVMYRKYGQYFGPQLAPTMEFPEAIIASAHTAHGVAWGSLTLNPRDLAIKGHLPRREIERIQRVFANAALEQAKILVVHHNVTRGATSGRVGLARWRTAERRLAQCGAELILCGHDHEDRADVLEGQVVVSCAGTLSTRTRGDRPAAFHRITIEDDSTQLELYEWDAKQRMFRRTDVHHFARTGRERRTVEPVTTSG